jgi:hypothetical protein
VAPHRPDLGGAQGQRQIREADRRRVSPPGCRSGIRFFPLFHFFVIPVLAVNLVVEIVRLTHDATLQRVWVVVVALALLALGFSARLMALQVQNRVIRLEERLRLQRLLPPAEQDTMAALTTPQLIGLRFASDEELPGLARRCAAGELRRAGEIKRQVKDWRADYLRA